MTVQAPDSIYTQGVPTWPPTLIVHWSGPRNRLPAVEGRCLAIDGAGGRLSVSNSLSGRHWELDQVPAVGDPTDIVQLGTGHRVAALLHEDPAGGGGLLVTLRRSHTTGMKSKVHPTYKTKYRVANWAAYNQALVRRGDVRRCCMNTRCGWGGVAHISRDPPQEPHYGDEVEGSSHV